MISVSVRRDMHAWPPIHPRTGVEGWEGGRGDAGWSRSDFPPSASEDLTEKASHHPVLSFRHVIDDGPRPEMPL